MRQFDKSDRALASRVRLVSFGAQDVQNDPETGASESGAIDSTSLTYEPGFGLCAKPFSLSTDPRFFFRNSAHRDAFDDLVAGLTRREGILVLTGEVGTGKTTLCRTVLRALDRKTFAAFVPDPFLSPVELLRTLLVDFGVVSLDDLRTGRLRHAGRTELTHTVYEFLTSLQPLHEFAVVIVDEAQNLDAKLLEEIRILSDLEDHQKLLQFVLVGQPELQSRLRAFDLRHVAQRISVRCELPPLARSDIGPYISHRLMIAGNQGTLQFADETIDVLFRASSGVPRVINLVCDRALTRAARAGTTNVETEHVFGAVDDLGLQVARTLRAPKFERDLRNVPFPERKPQEVSRAVSEPRVPSPLRPLKSRSTPNPQTLNGAAPRRKLPGNLPAEVRGANIPQAPPLVQLSKQREGSVPTSRGRRWLPLGAALVVLSMSGLAYRNWTSESFPRPADVMAIPAKLFGSPEPQLAPTEPGDAPSTERQGQLPSPEIPRAVQSNPARFVLEVGTFESIERATQALDGLRSAGFGGYTIEVSDGDGSRAFGVFLGPYSERAPVERDLERARQIPGYDAARIVPIGPVELPAKPES